MLTDAATHLCRRFHMRPLQRCHRWITCCLVHPCSAVALQAPGRKVMYWSTAAALSSRTRAAAVPRSGVSVLFDAHGLRCGSTGVAPAAPGPLLCCQGCSRMRRLCDCRNCAHCPSAAPSDLSRFAGACAPFVLCCDTCCRRSSVVWVFTARAVRRRSDRLRWSCAPSPLVLAERPIERG
jgi:hypothetical protein